MSFAARMMAAPAVTTPPVVLPASITVNDFQYQTDASATFIISDDGTYSSFGSVSSPAGTWLNTGSASSYEVRFTPTSGSVSSGDSVSVWLALSSTRSWVRTTLYTGQVTATTSVVGTLEIRNASTQAVLTSSTLTLTAEVTDANPP
jgi:hypothetical protein